MVRGCILIFVLLAAGCATTSGGGDWTRFSNGSLDAWLVREAVPMFAETLSQHPRFNDETIRVAVMTGEEVDLRTNALNASLRNAVHSRLLREPGLTLVLQDSPPDCRAPGNGYYLGLELTRGGRNQAQAQLRLYDIVEARWVSGFTSQWRGQLSTSQQRLAAKPEISENARGLRVLPFESGQSDLLAAYLARDLACELRRRGDDELVVQPAGHNAAGLVAGNLAGDHGIAVATNGQLTLDTRLHEVGDGLYQVWAILTPQGEAGGRTLAASAYARAPLLGKPATATTEPATATEARVAASREPAVAKSGSEAVIAVPRRPTPRRATQTRPLLRKAQIVTPANYEGCSGSFWRGQGIARGTDALVSHDDCFAIEFDAHPKAQVFIVGLDTSKDVVRLYPSSCSPGGLRRGQLAAHRFPADSAIGWDSRLGTETIFIIAARDRAAAERVERLVRSLPAACSDKATYAAGRGWLDHLRTVVDSLGDEVSVETLRIQHTPGRQHAGTMAGDTT